METTDKQFFLTFLSVTGLLIILAVIVLVAANMIGSATSDKSRSAAQIKLAQQRIEPVGKVNLKSDPVQAVDSAAIVAVEADSATKSESLVVDDRDIGKQVYGGICQACHSVGVAAAPVVGEIDAWTPRLAQGMDELYRAAILGKGLMPPKGGNPGLTDAEVKAAVDYMVKLSSK